jgi:hypothetical protein
MRAAVDSYQVTAKHYDGAYAAKQDLVDLPSILTSRNSRLGQSSKWLAAPGAFCCRFARQGTEIHGIDNSRPMLKIL